MFLVAALQIDRNVARFTGANNFCGAQSSEGTEIDAALTKVRDCLNEMGKRTP
jgi:hypothetical protein